MKTKAAPTSTRRKGFLVQLRVQSKNPGQELTPYEAWEIIERALKYNPDIQVEQAEFRVDRRDYRTGIED